ncbi:MAG: proteasome endopeptidase complex, archaeal, beta subunit [Thermoprotei archaeon]|nr:MAG: proteasome endopeptidase complex, archaeal, beta subunit [Thermoprotei archaeon]
MRELPIGATAVGIVFNKGVVLAAEKRVAYGFTLMSRAGKKVFKITDKIGFACAGLMADMQAIARIMAAEIKLYELESGHKMLVRSAAKLLSQILFSSSRQLPYITEIIVGGIDRTGPHLFVLDPIGSLIEDKYVALGSGAKIAIGILESNYKDGIDEKTARDLAILSVKTAIGRDAISGDGIDLLLITTEGTKDEFIPV